MPNSIIFYNMREIRLSLLKQYLNIEFVWNKQSWKTQKKNTQSLLNFFSQILLIKIPARFTRVYMSTSNNVRLYKVYNTGGHYILNVE